MGPCFAWPPNKSRSGSWGSASTLSGFADSQEQANRAAEAPKGVQGVRSVKNDIRVK